MQRQGRIFRILAVVFLSVASLWGCSSPEQGAAPIGQEATLERLSKHYTEWSKRLPMAADRLPEKERKDFIVKIFSLAGYDYAATLKELVSGRYDIKQKHVRDLAELLTLPHRYLKWDDRVLQRLYNAEELEHIKQLQRMLDQSS